MSLNSPQGDLSNGKINEFHTISQTYQEGRGTAETGKTPTRQQKMTLYRTSSAVVQRTQNRRQKKLSAPAIYFDSALASNVNYMNVIKESHESILRRQSMAQANRQILSMEFKKRSDKADWECLNKFL